MLELSRLLGLDNEDYEAESSISTGMGKTLSLLAEAGLEQNDGKAALGFCQQMIKARFGGGWAIIKCVRACVHVHVCVCICACVRACVRASVHACVRACVCACVCAFVHACVHTCVCVCVCVCVHVCIHV